MNANIKLQDWGVTLLRVAVGIIFLMHGGQKLFVYGLQGFEGALAHIGLPTFLAPIVMAIEFLGGAALVLGLGTRIAAAAIALNMLGAIFFIHLKNGFFLPNGFEYAFAMFASNAALVLTGAGAAAIDNWLAHRKSQHVSGSVPALTYNH